MYPIDHPTRRVMYIYVNNIAFKGVMDKIAFLLNFF